MTAPQQGAIPKSPRYFYPPERAHHAMSMGIDHGMVFEINVEGERRTIAPEQWRHQRLDLCSRFHFYIHPDSLHLLEPQAKDVCVIDNERIEQCYQAASEMEIGGKLRHVILLDGSFRLRSEVKCIIQRNGLPFHWPESKVV